MNRIGSITCLLNLEVLVLSSEGNFDPQRLALESGSLLLGPMEEAGDITSQDLRNVTSKLNQPP